MTSEVAMVPDLAEPGATWDGGPPSALPILKWQESRPILATAGGGGLDCFLKHGISKGGNAVCGGQDSTRCTQKPHLVWRTFFRTRCGFRNTPGERFLLQEYSDEAVQSVHSTNDRIFAPSVELVANGTCDRFLLFARSGF